MKRLIIFTLITFILIGWIAAPIDFNVADRSFEYTIANAQPIVGQEENNADTIRILWQDVDISKLFAIVGNAILSFFGVFTWLAGILLNFAVSKAVIGMGSLVENIGGIESAWTVLRDLANIALIFAMLAIGIATILRVESYGVRRLLATLIIVALLVNFSLFFTSAIIDISNILATVIFNSLTVVNCADASVSCATGGISNVIMNTLHLTSLFDTNPADGSLNVLQIQSSISIGKIMLLTFLGSILLMITAFVFFAGAILLTVRFVVLIILMIFSPLAFVGMILPSTKSYALKWWRTLFAQSFFAPLYLLMIWISISIFQSMGAALGLGAGSANSFSSIADGAEGGALLVLNFIIVMIFMIASLVIARELGAYGSNTMIAWGHSARRWGQGVAGRNTAGRVAELANRAASRVDNTLENSRMGRNVRRFTPIGWSLAAVRGGSKAIVGTKFGSTLSRKDAIETREKRIDADVKTRLNDPQRLAGYFRGLNRQQQRHMYESMSARNRAALDEALGRRFEERGTQLAERLRQRMSVDEREKTEDATRDARIREENRETRENIEDIARRVHGGEVVNDEDVGAAVSRLRQNDARRLSHEARMQPVIIQHLSSRHLRDLMNEGGLRADEVAAITDVIRNEHEQYANQNAQREYIDDNANRFFWN